MAKSQSMPLNTAFLETRMAELGIKQWWLAEQLRVNRRTVMRWVNGQVRSANPEVLRNVATHLECSFEDLVLRSNELETIDTVDQERAAKLIDEKNLLDVLTPTSNYELAEMLIRSVLAPGLAQQTRAKLEVLLAGALNRQFKLVEARQHASKASEIARRIGNKVIAVHARYQLGWSELYDANMDAAYDHFAACVQDRQYIDQEADTAMALFGLGSCQGYREQWEPAIANLSESIAILEPLKRPVDLSMPLYVKATFLIDQRRFEEALEISDWSYEQAKLVSWQSGLGRAASAAAEALLGLERNQDALVRAQRSLDHFADEQFIHPRALLAIARVFAATEHVPLAKQCLQRGLAFSEKYKAERRWIEQLLQKLNQPGT